jgi:hypothetical protein
VIWLIKLYPPAWRRRYGRELAELIATQPASFRTAIDLVAAAIDAWLNPQPSMAATSADRKGAGAMVPKMLQLKCAGYGPNVTQTDHLKAVAVIVVGSLALALAFVLAAVLYGRNPYFQSLVSVSWLVLLLFSQHYTSLKGRPAHVQAVLIGGPAAIVIAIALGAAWISS